jgi:hypothetical protein
LTGERAKSCSSTVRNADQSPVTGPAADFSTSYDYKNGLQEARNKHVPQYDLA